MCSPPLLAYPDFMFLVCVDIPSGPNAKRLPCRVGIVWIGHGELATQHKMCRLPTVSMWRIVSIAACGSVRKQLRIETGPRRPRTVYLSR